MSRKKHSVSSLFVCFVSRRLVLCTIIEAISPSLLACESSLSFLTLLTHIHRFSHACVYGIIALTRCFRPR
ncbi:hypothetical protein F5Y12DRAFT_594088 [Xylaria sp. FL1777]|nr:hypothetical protein F5Y12DRAFT_594088 [Xylaria sp. FL1777]